jgi:CBS domain-containing protein
MPKAYEVMTQALATCAPDDSVALVAGIMQDRNIGNVLVVEDGKLRGIVTDRDLAVQALTGKDDPLMTPIRKFMSPKVVTGEAGWSLDQVAKTMAKHQIRRLPIQQDGELVGIVSFGDVALYEDRKSVVTKSLQAISTPLAVFSTARLVRNGIWVGFALATTMVALLTWNRSSQAIRKHILRNDIRPQTLFPVNAARV